MKYKPEEIESKWPPKDFSAEKSTGQEKMIYNSQRIESKWRKIWEKKRTFRVDLKKARNPYYNLMMFPYPSAEGLHVGNVYAFTGSDIHGRFQKMRGFDVFEPIGFDAFGIHSENFAIKKGIHPKILIKKNIDNFRQQLKNLGCLFDWRYEVDTTQPDYYKWTQWLFLQLFKAGLAFRKKAPVDWCPSCKTVLADEQVIQGKCERCDSQVVQKETEQWFFKITKYAERLLKNLDIIDWSERTKIAQRNWIGKSQGALIKFLISNLNETGEEDKSSSSPSLPLRESSVIEVFTTRPDTLFGCTYLVISPEHHLIEDLKLKIENWDEVQNYIKEAKRKSELERTELIKEKTGVQLKEIKVINPANNEEIPVFVADYVLASYGTGVVMAVPAHDQRDFEFAKKYSLPIIQTVALNLEDYKSTIKVLELLKKIQKLAKEAEIKVWVLGGLSSAFHANVIYRLHEDLDLIVKTEADFYELINIFDKAGFKKIREKKLDEELSNIIFQADSGIEIDIGLNKYKFGLKESDFELSEKNIGEYKALVLSKRFIKSFKEFQVQNRGAIKDKLDLEFLNGRVVTEDGYAINSGQFNGLATPQFKKQIIQWLEKNKLGRKTINYHLRDWLISRQRYWGPPIPIIYCKKCGTVPVPEKDLPVLLPYVKDFRPTGTGKSPLASVKKFVNTKCPKCKSPGQRETDVSDTFFDSAWYFFRYPSAKISNKPFDKTLTKKWLPVDMYIGGQEHAVLHLLYTRFITMALKDSGFIEFEEPFKKFRAHGLLTKGGAKMSKSKGNVVNPDNYYKKYGADTLRMYLMFSGPFSEGGDWRDKGIVGIYRFLIKVWNLKLKILASAKASADAKALADKSAGKQNSKLEKLVHQTIKKVTEDIENLRYNTAISTLMILVNEMERQSQLSATSYQLLLKLLAPFAPHITEELWVRLGHKESISLEKWPEPDPEFLKEEKITLIIQVNGKVRDKIEVEVDIPEKKARELAISQKKIKNWLEDKEIKKVIFVPGKLINIVV